MLKNFQHISEFGEAINRHLSTSKPVDTLEKLLGRDEQLNLIEQSLFMDGRHIFIYGDRGVGKSSLARTAAYRYQSSENVPIEYGCYEDTTFFQAVEDMVRKVIRNSEAKFKKEISRTVGFNAKFVKYELTKKTGEDELKPVVESMNQAVDLVSFVGRIHSEKPIIVIDEFDRISDGKQRALFAEFLKHLGDQNVNVKLVFTGVGTSLDELLGAHKSSVRQLTPIELKPLSLDSLWDIAIEALQKFGIEIDRNLYIRLAQISNGFPYYVHLITERLLWVLFYKEEVCEAVSKEDFYDAIDQAIENVNVELKKPYNKATKRRTEKESQEYNIILWAASDGYFFERHISSIYRSYEKIIKELNRAGHLNLVELDKARFSHRVRNLKKESHGTILISGDNPGWYKFRENMERGYCRLVAESNGIELGSDLSDEPRKITAYARESGRIRGSRKHDPSRTVQFKR